MEKEFALLFMVHDENQSWYLEDNIRKYLNVTQSVTLDAGFHESNMMHGETTFGRLDTRQGKNEAFSFLKCECFC